MQQVLHRDQGGAQTLALLPGNVGKREAATATLVVVVVHVHVRGVVAAP